MVSVSAFDEVLYVAYLDEGEDVVSTNVACLFHSCCTNKRIAVGTRAVPLRLAPGYMAALGGF